MNPIKLAVLAGLFVLAVLAALVLLGLAVINSEGVLYLASISFILGSLLLYMILHRYERLNLIPLPGKPLPKKMVASIYLYRSGSCG